MANNVSVRDALGASLFMKTSETSGVHTPIHRIDGYDSTKDRVRTLPAGYDPVDDMIKVKSMQKKFRDSFNGVTLDTTKWTSAVGTGGSLTVSGGVLTMASGTTANAGTYIQTIDTFTVPFRVSLGITMSQRIINQTLYVEAISVNATTGIPDDLHSCGFIFDGTVPTTHKYRVQNGGLTPLDSALSVFPTTASGSVYEIEPFSDEVWFHGGILDSNNARANSYRRHQQIPDPNAVYVLRIRWLNGAVAPVTTTTAVLQYIACQDYAELTAEITAGRGQTVAGQAIGVSVLSAPTTPASQSGTWTVMPGNTANTVPWLTKASETLGTATLLGALNAEISQPFNGVIGIGAVITASATPVGVVLTPYVSCDGGTNWTVTQFFNVATASVVATLSVFSVGDSYAISAGDGATHVKVRATSWTSGSVTVRLSASNSQGLVNLKSTAMHDLPIGTYGQALIGRASAAAPTAVSATDDAVMLWATTSGALNVADGGGSLTVDGIVSVNALPAGTNVIGYVANQDNIFWNDSVTAQAGAATVTGATRDTGVAAGTGHRYSHFNAYAFADQSGMVHIECSNDNITWRRATPDNAVTANSSITLSVFVMTRYYRVVYVNGATIQTAFMLNTSFTAA